MTRRTLVLVVLAVLVGLVAPPAADAGTGDIERARSRANAAAAELARAESRLGELEAEIADLEAHSAETRRRIGGLEGAVRELAVQQYINAGETRFFADDDINRQARADALARYVQQGNTDAMDDFLALQAQLAATEEVLTAKRADQSSAVESLKSVQAKLASELRRLEEAERKRQEEEARRRAAAAAAAARRAAASARPAPVARALPVASAPVGGMVCPIAGPNSFVDTWGAPRSGGRRHKGVDMLSPRGTPVVAPVGGTVTHRGNSVGGLSYHLSGDNGHYYYGTHLNGYGAAGRVSQGTVIGYVGDTGNARGTPHLHFEIHPNGGAAVNPYPATRAAC